jgi:hypothetical protein
MVYKFDFELKEWKVGNIREVGIAPEFRWEESFHPKEY